MKKTLFFFFLLNLVTVGHGQYVNNHIWLDFDVSMQSETVDFKKKYTKNRFNKSLLRKLMLLYNKHAMKYLQHTDTPRIPRIIHQIWVGPNPLPEFYKKLAETWQQYHPDWTYMLWTDDEAKNLDLHNRSLYDKAESYVEKADILRLEVLYKFGGVYVDMDFECLKPLDVLHYYYDFYTGITPNNAIAVLANGLIGAIPGHPLIEKLVNDMNLYAQKINQVDRNGVNYFSLLVSSYFETSHKEIDIALPATYFYPFKKHYGTTITDLDVIRPESFGIHYWGKTLAQKINLYNQKR